MKLLILNTKTQESWALILPKKMIWLSRKIFYERWSFTRTVFVSLWVFHWTLAIQICAFKCLIDVSPTTPHLLNFEIFLTSPLSLAFIRNPRLLIVHHSNLDFYIFLPWAPNRQNRQFQLQKPKYKINESIRNIN